MTKTDIGIYRGLKEKFDPEVHVGFFITTDTGELLSGDQSLGQTISGWEINDGVLILKLNTGKDIRVTFPEATETVKGLLSAADKAQLNALQANLDSKVDKVTGKSLLADSEIEKLAGLPNSTELTNSIATAKAAGDNAQSDLNAHKQNKSNPHEVTKAQVGLGNVTNDAQVKRSEMGVANGVATLDADGKVPAAQLPSYVDDIIDVYATYSKSDTGVLSDVTLYLDAAHTQLVTGEAGKIYQNIADGEPQYQFRWTGTIFSQTGASSLILGEVTGTAYDGAKGKANADNIAKIKGTSLSHIKDAAPITTAADKVSLNYECFEGNQYGAAGTAHTADIPSATTSKAGVMSAADKTKLENLNSKLVVADEEDVTAVEGKIKLKDRDTTNGMGYKILRLPENGILTQDMINQANTIYEIRYNFDLNGATITIPENCTLKFEGGKLSNGIIEFNNSYIENQTSNIIFDNVKLQNYNNDVYISWFSRNQDDITSIINSLNGNIILEGTYVISNTIILKNRYIKGGKLTYNGPASSDIVIVRQNGGVDSTSIDVSTKNFSGSIILVDYTDSDIQWDMNDYKLNNLLISNSDTSVVTGSTCIKINISKYQVITRQLISDIRFNGVIDRGIHVELLLRNTNDNPTYNTSTFKNIFFKSANCALYVHPKFINTDGTTYDEKQSKGFVEVLLDNFANQYISWITSSFMDIVNTNIEGNMVIPWDYYGDNIPSDGIYKTYNSSIYLSKSYFDDTHSRNESVLSSYVTRNTGEKFTDINSIRAARVNNNPPIRKTGIGWAIPNVKIIEFIPPQEENPYNMTYRGFEIQADNAADSQNRTYQIGIAIDGNFIKRRYHKDTGWGSVQKILSEGNMPVATTSNLKAGKGVGDVIFNTSLGLPMWWNGTKWIDPAEDSIKWRTIE